MKSNYRVVLILLSLLVVCGIMFIILRKHEQYSTLPPTIQAVTSAAIRIQSVAPMPPTILKSDRTIITSAIAAICGDDTTISNLCLSAPPRDETNPVNPVNPVNTNPCAYDADGNMSNRKKGVFHESVFHPSWVNAAHRIQSGGAAGQMM